MKHPDNLKELADFFDVDVLDLVGEKGEIGATGSVGETGEQGIQGIEGEKGEKGEKGEIGDKGKDGKSIKGEKGKDGKDGREGKDGEAGKDGRSGIDGKDGEVGRDGVDGKDGLQQTTRIGWGAHPLAIKQSGTIKVKVARDLNFKGTGAPTITQNPDGTTDLDFTGGAGITRTAVVTTGSITMGSTASTDYVYSVAGAHIMSLPSPNTNRYTVKNNHSANITIDTAGAELIEGAASISINPESSVDIFSDATNWYVV